MLGDREGQSSGEESVEPLFLTEKEAAHYLGFSPRTLQGWRPKGAGPEYHKIGHRVRYTKKELEAWADSTRRRSTADPGGSASYREY
jgi:predicted DNA-binding transcriptional regulator AlpA